MNNVTQLRDWPQPAVVAEPVVSADDWKLALRYNTADGAVAIIKFPLAKFTTCSPFRIPLWNAL